MMFQVITVFAADVEWAIKPQFERVESFIEGL